MDVLVIYSDLGYLFGSNRPDLGDKFYEIKDAPEWILDCHNLCCGSDTYFEEKLTEDQQRLSFKMRDFLNGREHRTQCDGPFTIEGKKTVICFTNITGPISYEEWKGEPKKADKS